LQFLEFNVHSLPPAFSKNLMAHYIPKRFYYFLYDTMESVVTSLK
jgi:hypothetical protein